MNFSQITTMVIVAAMIYYTIFNLVDGQEQKIIHDYCVSGEYCLLGGKVISCYESEDSQKLCEYIDENLK